MKISYVNLSSQWNKEKKLLMPIINKVLQNGNYVNGNEIKIFEKKISKICNTKYAVALNSGTDALLLGLHLLGVKKDDEVITPPNSFISSTSVISHIRAKPVFVDVLRDQNINPELIEKAITKKTKAIMPVHLTGRIAEMNEIMRISKKYGIPVIEDAAQSINSKYYGKKSGSFGEIGCFSAHPLKNLNACGDSGFIVTNNFTYYKKALAMRNHGLENRNLVKKFGFLSRMDVLQAAILNYRIKNLNPTIAKRRENAKFYLENLSRRNLTLIDEKKYQFNTYHTFVIQAPNRDKLIKFLKKQGIATAIHYPIPIHLQPAAKYLGYKKGSFKVTEKQSKEILSLPINQNLNKNEILYICKHINNFYKNEIK
jgi:dTDP-4-amino-4,6-dideoxygalactose transaminase